MANQVVIASSPSLISQTSITYSVIILPLQNFEKIKLPQSIKLLPALWRAEGASVVPPPHHVTVPRPLVDRVQAPRHLSHERRVRVTRLSHLYKVKVVKVVRGNHDVIRVKLKEEKSLSSEKNKTTKYLYLYM